MIINPKDLEEDFDEAVEEYTKDRHYLSGGTVDMKVDTEKPDVDFSFGEPKKKSTEEKNKVEFVKFKKQKSNKLF